MGLEQALEVGRAEVGIGCQLIQAGLFFRLFDMPACGDDFLGIAGAVVFRLTALAGAKTSLCGCLQISKKADIGSLGSS